MIIRLIFEEDVPEGVERPARTAERDFEWEESMGSRFPVANPENPADTLELDVYDNETGKDGKPMCTVMETKEDLANFDEILKYGFVEARQAP